MHNKKIWVIYDRLNEAIVGVYSTEEMAIDYLKEIKFEEGREYHDFDYEGFVLDE